MSDGAELRASIRQEQSFLLAGQQGLGRIITEFERSQSRISGLIIQTFSVAVLFTVGMLGWLMFARTYLGEPQDRIDSSISIAKVMAENIQNSLLPVVTLVLGFYFGSVTSRRE